MQTARDALAHGVQTLFSGAEPPPRRSPRPANQAPVPLQCHPLCECLKLQPLPEDWTHLQRHPVLKQHVLTQWTQQCDDFINRRQAQRKRATAATTRTPLSSSAYAKDRAVVVQSVHSLYVLLFRCGLLHAREHEFVQLLEQRETRLPMRARMLLIQMVLQLVCKRALHDDVEVLKLMEDLLRRTARQTVWACAKDS
uniref:Uncharacterized protein n=1 Tax=Globisporangium ultimum (strain ATCC 200006 / CBS 805.95 / DAOM BR144) TaxID=431595 RepID=K3WLC3_GLOUD